MLGVRGHRVLPSDVQIIDDGAGFVRCGERNLDETRCGCGEIRHNSGGSHAVVGSASILLALGLSVFSVGLLRSAILRFPRASRICRCRRSIIRYVG